MENEKFHRQDAVSSKKPVSDMGSASERTSGAERLLDAIGALPEDMIGEASKQNVLREKWERRKRVHFFLQISSGVAAAALLAIAIWGLGRENGYFGGEMSETNSKRGEKGSYEQSLQATEPPLEIWSLSVEVTGQSESASEEDTHAKDIFESASGADTDMEGTHETAEDTDQNSTSSKAVPSEGSALEKKGDTSDSLVSPQRNAEPAGGETAQGQRLRVGQVYPVKVSTTGKGEERSIHFTLQFGREVDSIRYRLKASSNLSMELTALPSDENNNMKLKGNKKSQIQCASGTQIGCGVRLSEAAAVAEDVAIPEWIEKNIRAIAEISITAQESAGSSGEGRIVLGESGGNYYIVYLAE